MGSAMAGNLLKAGVEVRGYDVVAGKRAALKRAGGKPAASIGQLKASVIITSLPSAAALHAVAEELKGKSVVIETSTLPIEDKEKARDTLKRAGITLLDCPLSGTGAQAKTKDLVVFASGERKAFDLAKSVFPAFSRSHYYLGKAQQRRKQHLLAAQSFTRLTESFPDDTLADDALMEAGDSYAKLWRKPALDPQYGHTALATYRTLLSLYPNSALRPDIERRVVRLEQLMATKDYETGMYYLRRKFYDPAVLYFKDVIRKYPDSGRARDSYIRLVQAYRAIKYRDDLKETCDLARERYPGDAEFNSLCPAATATPVAADSARAVP